MKLNELLDREGFASVNDRTNISIDILLRLVDGDFEELSRVRALGFSSILKREYNIELDELDNAIKEYFKETTMDSHESVIVAVDRKEGDSSLLKWIIILSLLGGLWYLYSSGKLGGNLSNDNTKDNVLNDSEILKSSISKGNTHHNVIIKKDANRTKVEIKTGNITIQESESNSSVKSESNKTAKDGEHKVKNSVKDKEKKENKELNVSSADIENSLDETIKEGSSEDISSATDASKKTPVNDEDIAEIIYTVTVNPRVNLWFGFINIDTKERKEFMTTASTAIDVGEQRWILMTGHGRVTVASGTKTLEINDRVKHYFYMDSSEIREINRSEFKKYNGGKGW